MNSLDKRFEEIELQLVDLFCNKDRAAVDIGTAGSGVYTEKMLQYSSQVYSFEAHPVSAQKMRERYGDRIILRECAVTNYIGTAVLSVPKRESGVERSGWSSIEKDFAEHKDGIVKYKVQTTTLDEENLPPVSLIKIDVEGAEPNIIV